MRQIDPGVNGSRFSEIEQHYDWGFGVLRNFHPVSHTALDVVDQYKFAEKNKWLSKNDAANYNNRWLQFTGAFQGKTKQVVDKLTKEYQFTNAHIYANWIENGHNYGRHTDEMDVIILNLWGQTAYCCESVYGDKAHSSAVINPGDAIFIRAGTHHTPIILGQRMSVSFSWV